MEFISPLRKFESCLRYQRLKFMRNYLSPNDWMLQGQESLCRFLLKNNLYIKSAVVVPEQYDNLLNWE
jgi:hypothetical protein